MDRYVNIIGIILVMCGTILSLWSVLGTKADYVQTAGSFDHQQDNFMKDKKKVINGRKSYEKALY